MGWDYGPRPPDIEQWIKDRLTWGNQDRRTRCLEVKIQDKQVYAAVESKHLGTGRCEVWAAVALIDPRGDELGIKEMDETMVPFYYNCPENILNLLTPTDDSGANKWRQQCWKKIGKTPWRQADLPKQTTMF